MAPSAMAVHLIVLVVTAVEHGVVAEVGGVEVHVAVIGVLHASLFCFL